MSIIIPANSAVSGGYEVANSLMFNAAKLTRQSGSTGNRRTWTWSGWVKRAAVPGTPDAKGGFFSTYTDTNNRLDFGIDANHRFFFKEKEGSGATIIDFTSIAVFQDPAAFLHFVIAVDTTEGTAADRVKVYLNGVRITSWLDSTAPTQNRDTLMNVSGRTYIVGSTDGSSNYWNGNMAEVVLIDGLQLAPTSFGEFDEDSSIWKPIKVSGLTFGTNGYYLDFEDSSALGNDAAGSNNYSLTSIAATDQGLDTCTNNFPVINALNFGSAGLTFADANTSIIANSGDGWRTTYGTIAVSTGKWYWEQKILDASGTSHYIGITDIDVAKNIATNEFENGGVSAYAYRSSDGKKVTSVSGSTALTSYGTGFTTNNIVGIAIDLDNQKIYFSLNGTWQNSGNPESGATGTGAAFTITSGKLYTPATATYNTSNEYAYNFGSPYFAISSGNSDADGFGNFEYTVPDGYFTICTKNLAEYG